MWTNLGHEEGEWTIDMHGTGQGIPPEAILSLVSTLHCCMHFVGPLMELLSPCPLIIFQLVLRFSKWISAASSRPCCCRLWLMLCYSGHS